MRRAFKTILLALTLFLVISLGFAQERPLVIGVLGDMSGQYADFGGKGAVKAVQMAVEDAGGRVLGRPVQVIFADHQNKPDVGAAIARRWFDEEGVDVVTDLGNSAVALAVQQISREKNRIALVVGALVSDLTGARCSPVSAQWVYDTWGQAHNTAAAVVKNGGTSWFFLTADYVSGKSLEAEASQVVSDSGGKVLGHVLLPFGTTDFSSALLQARSSGARIIGLANGGTDTTNSIKQAAEFGIAESGQRLAAMILYITDVHAMGLQAAQGLVLSSGFYWDQNEATRAWSKRYFASMNQMPSQEQAGDYSAAAHYLKAVVAAGTTDPSAVMASMRALPINDFMTHDGKLRIDGRVERDMYLFQVKKPSESKAPWDYYRQLDVIPAAQATRPVEEGGCPLVRK